ncbi:17.1 kDa class II heat shock protein-like [Coffea arabica]|uniref:17.1 kDa class II heat shock protein-like n=1 Tax=Coffea arabica TaxID=13443 RepID=A0A6P6U188_COFAR|nr:17.1 kDa class II heat shock protein-like [Coffea arabica]
MEMALKDMGLDSSMVAAIYDMLDVMDDTSESKPQHPSRAYIRDTKAMKATPADIIEYPKAYHFVLDMPGLKSDQIRVHLEDGNLLVVSGERRREKEKEKEKEKEDGVKYIRMERRFGKMLKKFILPENANKEKICATYQDGVLSVVVEKSPPPEPKKPKVIEVKIGQHEGGGGGGEASQEVRTEGSQGPADTEKDGQEPTKTQ